MVGNRSKTSTASKGSSRPKESRASDKDGSKGKSVDDSQSTKNVQSTRETVESIVVAFILAFLFRAFVAEAFVIPTGSMAPTLMGAHKDLFCEYCGQQYQASASIEFDSTSGALKPEKTIASLCSNCRGINAYDFVGNKNHSTFSGDRILVSKFDYVLSKPKRWDVFVFKYPLGARMNYIKRLVGLPGETVLINEGDIFVRRESGAEGEQQAWEIARKPPHKIQAMKRLVHNTARQPAELVRRGWPSSWQPWASTDSAENWVVEQTEDSWQAQLTPTAQTEWLRYFHKVADLDTWFDLRQGLDIEPQQPYQSQLVTDYLAYNTPFVLRNAKQLFELKVGGLLPGLLSGGPRYVPSEEKTGGLNVFEAAQLKPTVRVSSSTDQNVGDHWVGDLSGEFEVQVESETGQLLLDLVEFGVHFQCSIDVATGEATLRAIEGERPLPVFGDLTEVTGSTDLRGKGTYSIEFANFDDQLVLWINGRLANFEQPASYDLRSFRNGSARRPYWTEQDPLDAAPLGIGGRDLAMKVMAARVFRDIYYIAVQPGGNFTDYSFDSGSLADVIPEANARRGLFRSSEIINAVYSHPEWWSKTELFSKRGFKTYQLEEKQYFPLGDNSAASSDARAWAGHNFVEQRYLLGKALLVFWPHTWNTPLPFTPNIQRMGLIR